MNDDPRNSQPELELAWLARYFYARGFKDKAREIMQRLQPRENLVQKDNVIDMSAPDEERRA
jgi:hypothetical protein